MRLNFLLVFMLASVLSGCASSNKYYWGEYESSMYASYKDPSKSAELAASLAEVIQTSEKTNKPVAPGIYAEYGFMLQQQGKSSEAIRYYEKEKTHWPESTAFMNAMIQAASKPRVVTQK